MCGGLVPAPQRKGAVCVCRLIAVRACDIMCRGVHVACTFAAERGDEGDAALRGAALSSARPELDGPLLGGEGGLVLHLRGLVLRIKGGAWVGGRWWQAFDAEVWVGTTLWPISWASSQLTASSTWAKQAPSAKAGVGRERDKVQKWPRG